MRHCPHSGVRVTVEDDNWAMRRMSGQVSRRFRLLRHGMIMQHLRSRPQPRSWPVKAEQKSNVSVRTSKLPKYFPSTDNKFLYDRSPDLQSHAATICYDPPLHRLIWSWMTSSLVLNMMSGEAEVISHPASEIIS